MSEPVIYTRNYLDAESILTSTHGTTNINRIFDTDKDSLYVTSGANSDSTEVTLEMRFKENGADVSRLIDRIIIVNHNLKSVKTEYWNGSSYITVSNLTSITDATSIIIFSGINTERIKIILLTTQSANEEKQMGLLFACEALVEIEPEITSLSVSYRQKQSVLLMGDGQLQRTVVMHAPNRSAKYQAKISFRLMSDAAYELLRAVKEDGVAFLWQPESETKPEDIFLVHWTGPLQWSYTSKYKGAGKSMILDLKEV